ncbi:hypothetical protein BGZ81_002178 [Podila clonocystis]|nr:hypothetical protein BGZ81_002178 [Podila clonocystis]
MSMSILVADQEDRDQRRRLQGRAAQKSLRKSKEADLEELVPKATGREAILEKRRAQTAYHRRERSPDVELPEHVLMGTGDGDDYKSMLATKRRRKEAREDRKYGGESIGPSAGPSGAFAPAASGGGVRLERLEPPRIHPIRGIPNYSNIAFTMPGLQQLDMASVNIKRARIAEIIYACLHLRSFVCPRGVRNLHIIVPALLQHCNTGSFGSGWLRYLLYSRYGGPPTAARLS